LKPDERRKLLRDRGSRDIETKCMQEVAESTGAQEKFGYCNSIKARIFGEAKGGKPTYETKWMQEVERHIGGRGS